MDINYMYVALAAIVQFILGALWYSPLLFGKVWIEIMESTHLSPEELKKMQKEMGPFYGLQLVLTLLSTASLAGFIVAMPMFSAYHIAFWIWLGYIVPTQIAGVVWANTKKRFWAKQIAVMVAYQLVAIMLAAYIVSM